MRKLLLVLLALIAFPASAQVTVLSGQGSDGNLVSLKACDQRKVFDNALTTSTPVLLITGVSAKKIYVCGFYVAVVNTTAVQFTEGTGATCATGTTNVTGPMQSSANSGIVMSLAPFAVSFTNTAADSLCIVGTTGQTASGWISYTIQ